MQFSRKAYSQLACILGFIVLKESLSPFQAYFSLEILSYFVFYRVIHVNKIIHEKCSQQCLAGSKHTINDFHYHYYNPDVTALWAHVEFSLGHLTRVEWGFVLFCCVVLCFQKSKPHFQITPCHPSQQLHQLPNHCPGKGHSCLQRGLPSEPLPAGALSLVDGWWHPFLCHLWPSHFQEVRPALDALSRAAR